LRAENQVDASWLARTTFVYALRVPNLKEVALRSASALGASLIFLWAACSSNEGASPPGSDAGHARDAGGSPSRDASVDSAPSDARHADAEELSPPGNPCLPFTMPSASALFGSSKKVFAHYFYPFPLSIDDVDASADYYNRNYLSPSGEGNKWLAQGGYLRQRPLPVAPGPSSTYQVDNMEKEVEMAISTGITGFTVDVLDATEANPGSQLQNILTASAAVDSRFEIVVMPDMSALGADAATVESIIESVASSPAAYRLADGRLVVSAFDASIGSVSFWQGVFSDLSAAGIEVAFVPTFLGWQGYASAYAPISYGLADWGTATPSASVASQSWPAAAHADKEIFMMPVDPQQYRPKDFLFWEAENSLAFRDAWTSAIAGGSDWVQLVTWSDFSESGETEPYTDVTLATDIGTGFYDLNAYYASWFLTGVAPSITHDVLYYFYRREPAGAAAPAQLQPTTVVLSGGGPAQDEIELLAFLTEPGTLEVTIGSQTSMKDAPRGLTSFTVPLGPGIPRFTLSRGGVDVFSFAGKVQIYGMAGLDSGTLDLTYWSGSASAAGTCELHVP
jgi:glycosyl hydrolase family 71